MIARAAAVLSLWAAIACQRSPPGGGGPSSSAGAASPAAAPGPSAPRPLPPQVERAPAVVAELPSFAELAARADPAVVFIETEQAMFGHGRRIVAGGVGAGFVFDPNGLILTNHHVVAGATRIDVVFGEEDRRHATVVGADPPTDLAVLKVDEKNLPHLPLGNSDQIKVGDWVVAIGNPFGLSHTVSVGILSAKGRTRNDVKGLDASGYYDYLQTDASINPGNSGGPLLDLQGNVIGINTAIKPEANGIGFAIPIDMVRELLPELTLHGKVRRSALGVIVASVKDEDVARLGLGSKAGSLVTRVLSGGPGDRAGLRPDDVIVAFDDAVGAGPNRLRWLTSITGVGKTVRMKVARERRVIDVAAALGELPDAPAEGPP